jgi:hypothetical protein
MVLISKYGANIVGRVDLGDESKPWYSSLWWKDVCSIGSNLGVDWFSANVTKKVGNGAQTSFWRDKWIGDSPLKERFPRLFSISNQKEAMVAELWIPESDEASWRFIWRRRLFVWEENVFEELKLILNEARISEGDDVWCWKPDKDLVFTVKSTYSLVANLHLPAGRETQWYLKIFQKIWKCPAPSKVISFVWQLLHDRAPTKKNLHIRHVIAEEVDCVCPLCGLEIESSEHLFLYCNFATQVWLEIFSWLNIPFGRPHTMFSILHCLFSAGDPRGNKGRLMIACAVVWKLWNFRNQVLFEDGSGSSSELVEGVKIVSWKWWLASSKKAHCLYYEWRQEPGLCLLG